MSNDPTVNKLPRTAAGSIAALSALSVLAGCGGGDGDRQAKIDLITSEGVSQQVAECYVDELPEYDLDDFELLNTAENIDDVDDELFEAAMDAAQVCE